MMLTEAAKMGEADIIIDALSHDHSVNVQLLLQKVYQDFHTIRKHNGHLDLAKHLLECGAAPELTMFCEAARGGHQKLIELLFEGGLKRNLFTAAAMGEIESVRQIIMTHSSVVRETDVQNLTPLHYCAASVLWKYNRSSEGNFAKACTCLIDAGADVNALGTSHGLSDISPLTYCAWTGGHPGVAKILLENEALMTPRAFLAAVGHFQRHGDGNYAIAEIFLQRGFDINYNDGRTALHAFSEHEDARGVSWLLAHGGDVNSRDGDGNTPLHLAARRNSGTKVLRLLLDGGAQPEMVNFMNERAIDLAEAKSKTKAVSLLDGFS
jgi:ankyrin repeat protein